MAYFRCQQGSSSGGAGATITVTYDSRFYNKTMTCTKGQTTYTQITTSSGSTTFSVAESGVWTITCNGVSVNVTIVLEYSTQMKPDGATVTPTDDIQTWLKCGGVYDKNYTTIGQVLADTTTLLTLISDNNAVDYMVRSTTWASSVCANSTAMTDIGANDYCAETLLDDSTWCNAICNSTYFESVLNVKVPTMTSNTTPSGVASASDTYSENLAAWKAFDGIDEGNNDSGWLGNGSSGYLQYEFASPIKPYCFAVRPYHYSGKCRTKKFQMQGASGGSFSDISAVQTLANGTTSSTVVKFLATNNSSFKQFRLNITESQESYTGCNMLQIYGR